MSRKSRKIGIVCALALAILILSVVPAAAQGPYQSVPPPYGGSITEWVRAMGAQAQYGWEYGRYLYSTEFAPYAEQQVRTYVTGPCVRWITSTGVYQTGRTLWWSYNSINNAGR